MLVAALLSGCDTTGGPLEGGSDAGVDTSDPDGATATDIAATEDGGPEDVPVASDLVAFEDTPGEDAPGPEDVGEPDLPLAEDVSPDTGPVGPTTVSDRFDVRTVVEQLYVWNAQPGERIEVLGPDGELVVEGEADEQGSKVFREMEPGEGYTVRLADEPDELTTPLTIPSVESSLPDESFYASQSLGPGFQYLTTRDGTTLSVVPFDNAPL